MDKGIILLVVGGILYTVGDIFSLKWLDGGQGWYPAAIASYFVGMILLIESFKTKHIAVASMLIIVFNVLFLMIISVTIFKRPMTARQVIGVVTAIVSVFMLK